MPRRKEPHTGGAVAASVTGIVMRGLAMVPLS